MKYKLGDIVPVQQGVVPVADRYWLLNLDMVESNTGRIIDYLYVGEDEIGTSTIGFDRNNVLYSKLRPYLNKVVLPTIEGYATSELLPLRPKTELITREYLTYFLRSKSFVEYINEKTSGAKMPRANTTDLKAVEIDCPSLEEQKGITEQIDKIVSIIDKRKQELEELDKLIKSRFVEMFGDSVLNPFDWEQVTLKDVAVDKLSYGSGASAMEYDGECRYIRITDITGNGELNNDIKSPDKYDEKYLLHDGDILFARSGATVGKTFRYSEEKHGKSIYAGYLIRLVPNKEKVMPDYIFYYTKTEYYASFVKKVQRAVAQPNINAQEYGNLIICVPPMELQKEFVTFVEQVNKSKFEVQKSLDETQLLMDSLMQKYFG